MVTSHHRGLVYNGVLRVTAQLSNPLFLCFIGTPPAGREQEEHHSGGVLGGQ